MSFKSIASNSIVLVSLLLISIVLVVFTHRQMQAFVEANQQKAFEKTLSELLPTHSYNNKLIEDKVLLDAGTLSNRKAEYAYFAFWDNTPKAVIFPATALDGYGGDIQIMVSIHFDGSLAAVRVLPPHNETQGLGDAIEIQKSNWMLGFNNKSLENTEHKHWALKQDGGAFDQISGATLTSRAVVNTVYRSLVYFNQHQHHLLAQLEQHKQHHE